MIIKATASTEVFLNAFPDKKTHTFRSTGVRSNSRYQYDLHHELPRPKKDVPIHLDGLEILLGAAPTPDDITRSNRIIEAIRNTDINAQPINISYMRCGKPPTLTTILT
jgi:hypothetical protein